jgi:hypothetical protein
VFAAHVALDELNSDLAKRGLAALSDPKKTFSGITVGSIADGEANSIEELCRNWMSSLSSLYSKSTMELMTTTAARMLDVPETLTTGADRLPVLVLSYVANQRPGLERFFSDDVRAQRARRRTKVHGVIIDFAGSNLVANFGTMVASHHAASVDKIKRRMFDLIVERDSEVTALQSRTHEMIVQHPLYDDPQITERQASLVQEGIEALAEQSKRERIAFVPLPTVPAIGDHVLQAEQRVSI